MSFVLSTRAGNSERNVTEMGAPCVVGWVLFFFFATERRDTCAWRCQLLDVMRKFGEKRSLRDIGEGWGAWLPMCGWLLSQMCQPS